MKRIVLLPFACTLVVACQDQRSPTAVRPPSAQLMDGSTSGNRHFFFLAPLVKQPSFSGVFNPALKPIVSICQLDVDPTQNNKPIGCTPNTDPISPGPVTADLAGQQYKVNWDTKQSGINLDMFYRIQVFGASGEKDPLGFADVDPVNNGSQLKNVNTGEYIGLVDGRTLPIKFRIERNAFLPPTCTDCVEANISNNGGILVTNTGFAGASFPAGWLRPDFIADFGDQVVVTIERVSVNNDDQNPLNRCLPIDRAQFEGCYRFKTIPFAGPFNQLVTAGICLSLSEQDPQHNGVELFKVEEPATTESFVTRLPNVPATFVSCERFSSAGPPRNGLFALARRVASWLGPASLHAAHVGAGGLTGSFSRIGWALPDNAFINFDVDPSGASVAPGTIVNTLYNSADVTFTRTAPGAFCGTGTNVYANDHGPLPGGGFDFHSGNNTVTICPEGVASDFSENVGGRIQATFTAPASQVCLNVYPTGFQGSEQETGATGFIEAFDANSTSLGKVTSTPDQADRICVVASGIDHVQFAGSGDAFAIFDNVDVVFVPIFSDLR
jgi:hypothetical protein